MKRWSKLLKYSMPSRSAEGPEGKKEEVKKKSVEGKKGKERRSLKDKGRLEQKDVLLASAPFLSIS